MAKYTVLVRTFINDSLREPGEVIDYDGEPSFNLQPHNPADLADWHAMVADPDQVAAANADNTATLTAGQKPVKGHFGA